MRAQLLSCAQLFVTLWTVGSLWDFPGKNTGVGYHFFLRGVFPTQGSNPCPLCLLHGQADSLLLCLLGSPQGVSRGPLFPR